MSLTLDYVFASSKDDIKPRNVVRSLPRLSRESVMIAAYEEARADPSLRLKAASLKAGPDGKPEVTDGCWHVVAAIPGQEMVAMAHLVARNFGTYLPMYEGKPLVPGFVLVFAWGIDSQWRKILGAPGIGGLLANGEKASPVPWKEVDYLRGLEVWWQEDVNTPNIRKGRRRRWKRKQRATVTVQDWQSKLKGAEVFAAAVGLV